MWPKSGKILRFSSRQVDFVRTRLCFWGDWTEGFAPFSSLLCQSTWRLRLPREFFGGLRRAASYYWAPSSVLLRAGPCLIGGKVSAKSYASCDSCEKSKWENADKNSINGHHLGQRTHLKGLCGLEKAFSDTSDTKVQKAHFCRTFPPKSAQVAERTKKRH